MVFMRKAAVFVAVALLLPTLFLLVTVVSLNRTFRSPSNLKTWLKDSKVYDGIVDSILKKSQQTLQQEREGDVPLDRPEIKTAVKESFTPQFLQTSTEQFIDGTYGWLEGKSAKPQFQIDIAKVQQTFADKVGEYLRQRVASLPACARNQIPPTFDPFQAQCKPPGVNIEGEIQRIVNEIAASREISENKSLNSETLTVDENGHKTPYYQKYENLPKAYRRLGIAPWILASLTLLFIAALIFLSADHLRGMRRAAITFLAAGGLLLIGVLLVRLIFSKINQQLSTSAGDQLSLQQSVLYVAKQVERSIERTNVVFGVIFMGLAIAMLITLYFLNKPPEQTEAATP